MTFGRVLVCIVLFACSNSHAVNVPQVNRPELIIPFEIQNNFIILNFKVNSVSNIRFIYDSGSEHSLFFEKSLAELLNFKFIRRIQIYGSDLSMPISAVVAQGIKFETESKQTLNTDIIVMEENLFRLNEYFGIEISGIIGNSMFRNKVIELDYDKLLLKVYSIEQFDPEKLKFTEIPSKWIKGKPYIYPSIITSASKPIYNTTLLFDTGASIGLLLYTNHLKEGELPAKMIPGTMGMGLGGPIEGYIGRVDGITINEFNFGNIITHFQNLDTINIRKDESFKHGIIGNSLISHFNVALDFSNHKLYLKRNKSTDKSMNVDRSGLLIVASGPRLDEFFVKDIMKGSAGDLAQIHPGDKILKFNGISARFYTLPDINDRLANRKRDKVSFVLLRDGKKVKKTVMLKDVI